MFHITSAPVLGMGTGCRNVSLVQSEAGSIELGETNVLPGVLDHEVRSATGPTGRIHIHAIAGNPLEQLDLSGDSLLECCARLFASML